MPLFTDHPDDDNPEYDNPLGRLPNGAQLPADDQPDGSTFISFATEDAETIDKRRTEMSLLMLAHALEASQQKCLRVPVDVYKAFSKEKKAAMRIVRDLKKEEPTEPAEDARRIKNIAFFTECRKFYGTAQNNIALDLAIAFNAILDQMAREAEAKYPTAKNKILSDINKWRIGFINGDGSPAMFDDDTDDE